MVETPCKFPLLKRALSHFEVDYVSSIETAAAQFSAVNYSLIVVGLHVDDSRGLEIIKMAGEVKTRQCPTLVVRLISSPNQRALSSVARTLLKLNTIDGFFESDDEDERTVLELRKQVELIKRFPAN